MKNRKGLAGILLSQSMENRNSFDLIKFSLFSLGLLDDFVVLTSNDIIVVVDEKHHLWMHQWTNENGFYEILYDDELYNSNERRLITVNSHILCLSNGKNQIHTFSDCLAGK